MDLKLSPFPFSKISVRIVIFRIETGPLPYRSTSVVTDRVTKRIFAKRTANTEFDTVVGPELTAPVFGVCFKFKSRRYRCELD